MALAARRSLFLLLPPGPYRFRTDHRIATIWIAGLHNTIISFPLAGLHIAGNTNQVALLVFPQQVLRLPAKVPSLPARK